MLFNLRGQHPQNLGAPDGAGTRAMPYGCFQISQGPSRQHGQAKVLLVPCRRFCWGIFGFWDGMEGGSLPTGEKHKVTETTTKRNDRDVMMMTTTKSHEIVFDTKLNGKESTQSYINPQSPRPNKEWSLGRSMDSGFPTNEQSWVFGLQKGSPPGLVNPSPQSPVLPPQFGGFPSQERFWVGLCYPKKADMNYGWISSYFTNLEYSLIFCKNSNFCYQKKKKKTLPWPNFRNLAPRRMTSPGSSFGHHSFQFIRLIDLPQKIQWNQLHRRAQIVNINQVPFYYQPKQCTIVREILKNYHRFVSFWSHQYG